MKNNFIIFLTILTLVIIIPAAYAQIPGEDSKQKSIQVTLSQTGETQVKHVIKKIQSPSQIDLVNGTKSNLSVTDEEGNDVQYGQIGEGYSLMILPSEEETIIEYYLEDELFLKDNLWTLDFLYLESTSFIFPEPVDLIFVNSQPAFLGEKNGILCHGCKMILEYSIEEPKNFESVKISDKELLIEIRTWAEVSQFSLDPSKGIGFEVIGDGKFVTTIFPSSLMSKPYQVFVDGEKVRFHESFYNETHVSLNIRPENSSVVSITGTLVPEIKIVPEDSIQLEIIAVGVIIIVAVIVGIFFIKRKK